MKRLKSESELVDYRVCICACPKISWYIYEIAPRNVPILRFLIFPERAKWPCSSLFYSLVMLSNILMTISDYAGKGKKIIRKSTSVIVSHRNKAGVLLIFKYMLGTLYMHLCMLGTICICFELCICICVCLEPFVYAWNHLENARIWTLYMLGTISYHK